MKHFQLVLLFSFTSILVNGQSTHSLDFNRFGLRAGANFAHINFSKGEPPADTKTTWQPGLVAGVYIAMPISNKLAIQPEYLFSQMNSAVKENDVLIKLNYLSLPVFLKFQLTEQLALMAGPQFDLLISADGNFGTSQKLTHDVEESSIAATVGLELTLYKTFAMSGRYMQGLNHIGIKQSGTVQEFKFEMVQISASFSF
ncbi:PorT family protein [Cryomorpha ignava]|uniref:PorT family protein n=1 Tax=Cryomorpha ignava TaxID=101383 RepID=A0A7K3WQI6_9FLAO|nr:porin family protein [Cryomorpha ignava]NEN23748.1 PorT family protein [Cryomorpha ignava]